jgi:phage gp36-like protein
MPYLTQNDLLQRMTLSQLAQLTDDSGTKPPSVNATVVDGAMEEASGKVDGYCRNKYATPLQQSDQVTAIARDIAVYLLFSRRPGQAPESVRERYSDALALLKDISVGKAVLDQPTGATAQTINAGPVLPKCNGLRFTDKKIDGFV